MNSWLTKLYPEHWKLNTSQKQDVFVISPHIALHGACFVDYLLLSAALVCIAALRSL